MKIFHLGLVSAHIFIRYFINTTKYCLRAIFKENELCILSTKYYLLFTNWVQGPYQEIQAQGFSYSPSLRGLFEKPRACISWYGTSTHLVNSLLDDPF